MAKLLRHLFLQENFQKAICCEIKCSIKFCSSLVALGDLLGVLEGLAIIVLEAQFMSSIEK